MKITEKVLFNITFYNLSGQKFSKNAKNGSIDYGEFSKNSNSVTRQTILDWTKEWKKIPKLWNSNEAFLVIFKHRGKVWFFTLFKSLFMVGDMTKIWMSMNAMNAHCLKTYENVAFGIFHHFMSKKYDLYGNTVWLAKIDRFVNF